MNSYKNTSPGKSREYAKNDIGEYTAPKPPSGKSNSYEKIFQAQCEKDHSAMNKKHYSRAKMANK